MVDVHVVVVPSAGPPAAVPLRVPALSAGGGWWVVAVAPACHRTWFSSVKDWGMFTRVVTHVRHVIWSRASEVNNVRAAVFSSCSVDSAHLRKPACHSLTNSLLHISVSRYVCFIDAPVSAWIQVFHVQVSFPLESDYFVGFSHLSRTAELSPNGLIASVSNYLQDLRVCSDLISCQRVNY